MILSIQLYRVITRVISNLIHQTFNIFWTSSSSSWWFSVPFVPCKSLLGCYPVILKHPQSVKRGWNFLHNPFQMQTKCLEGLKRVNMFIRAKTIFAGAGPNSYPPYVSMLRGAIRVVYNNFCDERCRYFSI